MALELKKPDLNSNTEYLKGNSKKTRNSSIEVLAIAKALEEQRIKSGWKYIATDGKTMKLIKPN